jgi:C1A family cysteine protease
MQGTPTFLNRFDGPGTAAQQTITVDPSVTGQSSLELLYKRPFDVNPTITRHLSIIIPGSVSSIDLSDPNPPVNVDTKPSEDDLSGQSDDIEAQGFTASTLPTSFDWRTSSKVSDIRNQGGCGSCWAFGTTAVMESALRINKNISEDLSEQFLVSCGVASENAMCGGKYSCAGGCEDAHDYHVDTFGENQSVIGSVLESVFPYTQLDDDTGSPCIENLEHSYIASSWHFVSSNYAPTVEKIKRAIYAYGPVTTRVCVGANFGSYTSGVLTETDGTCSNHVVAIVGWDDATESWIVRNSWGSGYGQGGYVNIKWGISNIGTLPTYMTMPVTTTLPVSISPDNGTTTSTQPTFRWYAVPGAIGYRLRISNATTGLVDVEEAVNTSNCSGSPSICEYTLQGTLKGTNEKWEVAVAGQNTFSSAKTFNVTNPLPANDSPTGAIPMTLGELQSLELGSTFTVSSEDPTNVRDSGDLASAWYSFTPASTGVYTLNAYGSDFAPNLTVLKRVSDSSRTLVVYGETGSGNGEEYYKLSFTAVAGTTYLIDVSSAEGGNLNLVVNQETCPSGYICGAGVEGDGHVMNYPYIRIKDSNGNYQGSGYGDYSGYIEGQLYGSFAGPYTIFTDGNYSIAVTPNVNTYIFSPTAVGSPKTLIQVKDLAGNAMATDNIAVVGAVATYFKGTSVGENLYYYLPVGTYSFFASSSAAGLEIYKPSISIASSTNPGTVTLDASSSTLTKNIFSFDLDGIDYGYAYISSPDSYTHYMRISDDRNSVTFAAPSDTVIPFINFQFYDYDTYNWSYRLELADSNVVISSSIVNHSFQVGGAFTIAPYVADPPVYLGEGYQRIYPGIEDAYNNPLNDVEYYGDSGSGVSTDKVIDRASLLEELTISTNKDGAIVHSSLANMDDLTAQDWVYERPYPTYTLTDADANVTTLTPIFEYLPNPAEFYLTSSSKAGIWNISEAMDLGPYGGGVKTGSTDFEVLSAPPGADLIPNAIQMTLNTQYTNSTTAATVNDIDDGATLADPVNVCNASDIGSVWYSFTAPSSGIFTLDADGSDYDANLTVVKRVSSTSRTAMVCTETDTENYKTGLSFSAISGSTYLIGASSSTGGGNLSLRISKETCPSGYSCGVGVEGDGRVMHWPNSIVTNSSGDWVGSGYGYYSGFVRIHLNSGSSGTFRTITSGDYSVVSSSVVYPGYFTASAVGSPKASVIVKNAVGTQIATNGMAIVSSTNPNVSNFFEGTPASGSMTYYLPAGTYSFHASSDATGLQVYNKGYVLNSSHTSVPLTIILDASTLVRDTFTFDIDGFTTGYAYIFSPDWYGHDITLNADRTVTFAAPAGTRIPFINGVIRATDASSMTWDYRTTLSNIYDLLIQGGVNHTYQLGGGLTVAPYVENAPIRVDEGLAYLRPGVYDHYGNYISDVYYYGYQSLGLAAEGASLAEKRSTLTAEDGTVYHQSVENEEELTSQGWVWGNIYPTYTVTDPADVDSTYTPSYFGDWAYIPLTSSSARGIWSISESVNLGPFGGGTRTGTNTFEVYSIADYPAANDNFNNAELITSLPLDLGPINTLSATTESSDPTIPNTSSKGYASVWYKYIADQDGMLTINTFGSDYDTVLTVWQGTRGNLSNRAYGAQYFDEVNDVWLNTSKVELGVIKGQTYYIEVTQYVYGPYENVNILSVEPHSDIAPQKIGGTLHLHASLDPCYAFTLTTSSGGTVAASPAPNCTIGSKKLYSEGTEITVTGTKATNYGFLKWTDPVADESTDNPYTFTIDANTALKGNFVLLAAPGNLSPSNAWLTTNNTPGFSWDAVTYGSTYEIQIDNASSFSLPLEQTNTAADLSYTASTLTEGTHYWRVRTLNNHGEPGVWTAVRSFTVDRTPPAIPTLLTPAAAAWVRGTPTFTWSAPATATAYILEYADDEAFTTNLVSTSQLTTPKYTPATLALGEYWWRVMARDAAGNWSDTSTPQKVRIWAPLPTAPVLALPASGLLTKDNPLTFTWSEPAYAESFEIQFSRSSKFTPILNTFKVNNPAWSQPLPDGLLYWRVRGLNNLDEPGAWSAVRSFTLDTAAPLAPAVKTPAEGSRTTTTRPTFTVGSVATAKYYGFEVSLLDYDNFSPLWEGRSTKPSYTPTAAQELPFGQLYWRAYAEDAAGNRSAYSNPDGSDFQVSILKTPAYNSFVYTLTPTFTWTPVAGATGYHLRVGTSLNVGGEVTGIIDVIGGDRPVSTSYVTPAATPLTLGVRYYWQMCVYKGGACSDYTPAHVFKVASAPPAAPLLLSPKTATLTQDTTPDFSWSAAINAVTYEIQIDNAATFTVPLELVEDGLGLTYTPGPYDSLADGLHYWRVRGLNMYNAPGAWSATRTFTVDTTAPVEPTLVSPITGVVVTTYMPKFTVNKIADAKFYYYETCVNNFTDGGNCAADKLGFSIPVKVTTPTYVPIAANALKILSYYWRVKAEDAAGNISDWSDPALIFVTNQKAPLNGAVITTATNAKPVFSWMAYPGVTSYQLHVFDDPGLTNIVIDSGSITSTSYTVPAGSELGPGKYYWYVANLHPDGNMGSIVYSFTVSPAAPAAPLLTSPPTASQTNVSPVLLVWSEPSGAVKYDVQLSRIKTFTTLDDSDRVSTSRYDFTPAIDGLYYWRVRSVNEYGVAGAWSSARNFIVDTTAQAAPVLSAPLNNAIVNTQTPTMSIKSVPGATSYLYELDDDIAFGSVNVTNTSTKTSFVVPADQKLDYGKYYWRVADIDKAGNQSEWSEVRSFVVTIQKTPANGSYTTNARQPFTWAAVPGATGYEIQVCTNPANCDGTQVRRFTRPVSTSYIPTTGEAFTDGIYYWRMRVQVSGTWSDWTPTLKFTKIH